MYNLGLVGEDRAGLVGMSADSDDQIKSYIQFINRFAAVAGDINLFFCHDLSYKVTNKSNLNGEVNFIRNYTEDTKLIVLNNLLY